MKLVVNCTPHEINIIGLDGGGEATVIPPSGILPRISQTVKIVEIVDTPLGFDDIDIIEMKFGEVYDMPPVMNGVIYIVSRMVLSACPERNDFVCPGELVRDETGRIIGCKNLSR